jgi:hypothetical protein
MKPIEPMEPVFSPFHPVAVSPFRYCRPTGIDIPVDIGHPQSAYPYEL